MLRPDYPIIIITSDDEEKAGNIKKTLSRVGIFSEIMCPDEARRSLAGASLLIAVSDRYSSRIYSVLTSAKAKNKNIKTVLVGEASSFSDTSVDKCISYTTAVDGECISDIISGALGSELFFFEGCHVTTNLFGERFVLYYGDRVFLNSTEAALVQFLAKASMPYPSSHDISHYLCIAESSVAVIINSINKKMRTIRGGPMIKAKRYHGYYII